MKKILLVFSAFVCSFAAHAQWQITSGPNGAGHISSLAVKDSTVFAGTETGGVFITTDNGTTWTARNNNLTNLNDVKAMVADSMYVFAGLNNSLGGPAVFSTTDNAANWSSTTLSFIFFFSFAMTPGVLVAGTWDGVSVTTNNGTVWNSFSTGLPSNASVAALAFGGSKLFCGVSSSSVGGTGVFSSSNNGTSWGSFNTGLTNNTVVNALAVIGSTVFAGTPGGVFRSSTSTAGFTAVNNGLTNTTIRSFLVSGTDIFAGTAAGIFYSANNGTNWTDVSAGLPVIANIYSMTSDSTYLYAGTDSAVYRRPVSEIISGITEHPSLKETISVNPNPASTEFMLTIDGTPSATKEKYEMSLYNAVGEKILHHLLSGESRSLIDVSHLPSGIYFVRITDQSGKSMMKKVVKL